MTPSGSWQGLGASAGRRKALKATLLAVRPKVAAVRAKASDDQALIAHLTLEIQKLDRDRFGPRSERSARPLDQLELQLEELEAAAIEDDLPPS